jgi:hypothetical protein
VSILSIYEDLGAERKSQRLDLLALRSVRSDVECRPAGNRQAADALEPLLTPTAAINSRFSA